MSSSQAFPHQDPNHNILWLLPPGRLGFGLYFHQVTEKEGLAVLKTVYIMGLYRKWEVLLWF